MYVSIFARSFSRHDQKRLGYGAFIGGLLIALSLFIVFKSYLSPLPPFNVQLSMGIGLKMLMIKDTGGLFKGAKSFIKETTSSLVNGTSSFNEEINNSNRNSTGRLIKGSSAEMVNETGRFIKEISSLNERTTSSPQTKKDERNETTKMEPLCSTSQPRTEFCDIKGDVRVHGNSSSVYILSSPMSILAENISWSIRPYARKEDPAAMGRVREWYIKPVKGNPKILQCTKNHSIPAVLFSLAGYAGNHFHDFTDIIVPLFLTSKPFNGEVQFLITDKRDWWISKYETILNNLSRFELIDIDSDDQVHCFPSVTVGLKRHHKELSADPLKYSYSMKDFRGFLRSSYSLKRSKAIKIEDGQIKKPRLLILSRKRTRAFQNMGKITRMAKSLGYKVVAAEAEWNVKKFAEMVNSCDVLMGVHGAGLTNIVFLPEKAVFIQVVPIGLEWLSIADFGEPSKDMNLRYLEYNIRMEESTLIEQYPLNHVVLKDPNSIQKQGWDRFKAVYLEQQNVKLDVKRFRPTLVKALELLHQ